MADILWTGEEIEAAVKGQLRGNFTATGVRIDSRNVEPGDVFFAVPGKTDNDGHVYMNEALQRGATGVVIEHGDASPAVIVADTMKALEDLGQAAIERSDAIRIAITGSVGKTTCRFIMENLLAHFGKTHASADSLNNKWGVPLSLARMPKDAQFGVFEVGMNHAHEITPLSKQITPHLSIITTVASVHIEHLETIENIALAKAEIFHGMDADGIVILPRDSEQFPLLLAEARTQGIRTIRSFGLHPESDAHLLDIKTDTDAIKVEAIIKGEVVAFTLGIPGAHHALNALAVLTAIDALNLDIRTVLSHMAEIKPVIGRGNRFAVQLQSSQPSLLVIDETHNASPVAVEAALRVLAEIPTTGRRIAILGDMLELGGNAADFHAGLKKPIEEASIDMVFTSGRLMAHLAEVLSFGKNRHFPDSQVLSEQIGELLQPGDVVLIKGSRGAQMKRVVDALKQLGQVETMANPKVLHSA
jgi:UDP-N-acetylmuramoyl-tripeptide--D-alanyl-D-alanine ligase